MKRTYGIAGGDLRDMLEDGSGVGQVGLPTEWQRGSVYEITGSKLLGSCSKITLVLYGGIVEKHEYMLYSSTHKNARIVGFGGFAHGLSMEGQKHGQTDLLKQGYTFKHYVWRHIETGQISLTEPHGGILC